ncbi:hypothetical protein [Labilibaculum sp.]|uniref:HYC_CC_PP family protein n=1 Tax=Labilibaculum sp. TaxID=2060723 RepID=UPI0035628980
MQIKKFGHIIMVLLLLISTAGVSINKHYSGGELFSTAIFVDAESCCETPCGCCKETSEFVQVKADYIASVFDLQDATQLDLLFSILPVLINFEVPTSFANNLIAWDTSPHPLPDLCILNQVFIL